MATLNANAAEVLALMEGAGQPPLESLAPNDARTAIAQGLGALQGEPLAVGDVTTATASCEQGNIPLRIYRPQAAIAEPTPAIVFFHGGGFVLGDLELYDCICRRLCAASQTAVISVDYRLAPEHPFPAAVEDAESALRWIAGEATRLGIRADALCVAGDSAGANIATVAAQTLKHDATVNIAHQLLLYPVTDLSRESESYARNGEGYFLTVELMRYFRDHYLADPQHAADERASPLLAGSLAGQPDATVVVCGFDPLVDEGVAYAEALRAAGVATELLTIDDQIHGYLLMDGAIPEAAELIDRVGGIVQRAIGGREAEAT